MCGAMWDAEQRCKEETQYLVERKNRFEIENDIVDQDQSIPKSTGSLTKLRSILVQILKS